MGAISPQMTSLTIFYSTVYSAADQRKHESSASLAFVWGIHRGPVNSPHKWPVTRKMFPFDDVIMNATMISVLVGVGHKYNIGNVKFNATWHSNGMMCNVVYIYPVINVCNKKTKTYNVPRATTTISYCLTHWGRVTHICVGNLTILVQIMACRLAGSKPLSEPMMEYCQLDPKEQTSVKS